MKYIGLIIIALVAIVTLVAQATDVRAGATFVVNSSDHDGDANPGNAACDTGQTTDPDGFGPLPPEPECTLRAAIEEANQLPGLDTIHFATFYTPGAEMCDNAIDDDADALINDGCPKVGLTAESGSQCANAINDDAADDSLINDGCPLSDADCGVMGAEVSLIKPPSSMPVISSAVIIDGTSDPEFVGTPVVLLCGALAGAQTDGLLITGGGSTVKGLVINRFGSVVDANGLITADGIELRTFGSNTIENNCIGTKWDCVRVDESGPPLNDSAFKYDNLGHGVYINNTPGNIIGGTSGTTPGGACTGVCNVISGNGRRSGTALFHGIKIEGSNATANQVRGNFIGVDDTGTQRRGNAKDGIYISGGASANIIGDTADAGRNLISGNLLNGIELVGAAEPSSACGNNTIDEDSDGFINDGCAKVGSTAESGAQCSNAINDDAPDDTSINDGCPTAGYPANNAILGNFIGTTTTGAAGARNDAAGVSINSAASNCIGGIFVASVCTPVAGGMNVISANIRGMEIQGSASTGNVIIGNHIGTDVTGANGLGNLLYQGIDISGAPANTIGGTSALARNIISDNGNTTGSHGIEVGGSTASGNVIQGNYIGTDATGTIRLANGSTSNHNGAGVKIDNAPNTVIGGTAASARNLISGNAGSGIEITGSGATGTLVQGNFIGTNVTATAPLGNGENGIYVSGAHNSMIGGTSGTTPAGSCTGACNVISGNGADVIRDGVLITGSADGNIVQGNYLGTDINGTADVGNSSDGVLIAGATANTVGGTTPAARNVISGNDGRGVEIAAGATSNQVRGNYIGTDTTGAVALGNGGNGVTLTASGNTIGGTTGTTPGGACTGVCNVISGNASMGVEFFDVAATGNTVAGNHIGTNATGAADLGNAVHGVFINNAPSNTIGGTSSFARNLISGNNGAGVLVNATGATGNLVRGNYIGTDTGGTVDLGNVSDGVRIIGGASNNTVGGTAPGTPNLIAFNDSNGASVNDDNSVGNSFLSNSIHSNSSLGIDLGLDGASANDLDDPDTGANNLQNYPAISSALSGTYGTTLAGTLNSIASTAFTLQFFATSSCDSSGYGEGATLLGTFNFTTNSGGDVNFSQFISNGGFASQSISATATDPAGNTSEFAQCVTAVFTPDSDGDGVLDSAPDNCPVTQNPGQQNADGDSRGDACDNCPALPSPDQTDTDGDGQGNPCDPDDDNDGVLDGADNCPLTTNADQANADSDAQGDACDPDDDNDTVPDTSDNCPLFPNLDQADTDGDGLGDVCDGGLGYFHPLPPYRILDTRSGPQGIPAGKLQHNSETTVDVTGGPSGVPASNVSAVVINATVTEATSASFLTVYPTGVSRPLASNLNFAAGQTVPNLVTVKVGLDGNVKVYNASGQVHAIFDVVGWYGVPTGGSRFNAITPSRILDTRSGPQGTPSGSVDPNETITVDVTGVGGVPANATAVVLNVTVTQATAASFLTVFPSDATSPPTASNLNFSAGQTVPNLVTVKVGLDGLVKVYNKLGSVHVIFDVVGWYGATGDLFYPVTPARVIDTRFGPQGTPSGKVGNNATMSANVTVGEVSAVASGIVVNTTVTEPTQGSYLTVWPNGVGRPPTSNLNFSTGQTVPNLVVAKIGSAGKIQVYNNKGQVHVILDAVGYFAP